MLTSDDRPTFQARWVPADPTPPIVTGSPVTPPTVTPAAAAPTDPGAPTDPVDVLREYTASHESRSALHTDTRAAVDEAELQCRASDNAEQAAGAAVIAHRTEQAKDPKRRAGLIRQCLLAVLMVLFEFGPCYLGAQALGENQNITIVVTVLFVVALAGGEFGLDWAKRQDSQRLWKRITLCLGGFVLALGVLRLYYLIVTGTVLLDAVLGAGLLTAATAVFVVTGYLALRVAETATTWKLRRGAAKAAKAAALAQEDARQAAHARDRLVGALMTDLQPTLLATIPNRAAMRAMESAIRAYLTEHSLPVVGQGGSR